MPTPGPCLPLAGQEPADKQPRRHYLYELRGVVVHSGSAFAGHYYSYIKASLCCCQAPRTLVDPGAAAASCLVRL